MRSGEEAQKQRRVEFICRFVPEGVRSGHDLLYDFFDKKSDFVPMVGVGGGQAESTRVSRTVN